MSRCAFFTILLGLSVVMSSSAEPLKVEAKKKPSDKEWKVYDTWAVAQADGFQPRTEPAKLSPYGGDLSRKSAATGFFHTTKVGDRWWLVDPAGYLFIDVGMCAVSPSTGSVKTKAAFDAKFGTREKWAEVTSTLLWSNGFNGTGAWSDDEALRAASRRLPYTRNWNFMSAYGKQHGGTSQQPGHLGYPHDAIFVFDPEFETFVMKHAQQLAATKGDPWLVGHFSDNELPFGGKCLSNFLSLPADDPGHQAATAWVKEHGEDAEGFREFVMQRYFAIVSKAIRTYDPNHLFLGSRFYGSEKRSPGPFRAAGKYCDVISVNHYGAWTPDAKQSADWVAWSGKPFMITEFYAKGADTGMPNTGGAGWLVKTQKDRGLFYQNFCLGLLESKGCVGWHYFKYQDNDLDNPNVDPSNRDSNKGVITAYYEEYPEYLKLMRELNLNVYGLIDWMDKGGQVHP